MPDTEFVVDLMSSRKSALEKYREISKRGEPLFLSSVTVFEILGTAQNSKIPQGAMMKIEKALSEQAVIGIDFGIAAKAARLKALRKLSSSESLIVASALSRDEKLLTKNPKHFESIFGLKLESY